MITTINCYGLVVLGWMQFLVASSMGNYLPLHIDGDGVFGRPILEVLTGFIIVYALFALVMVFLGTRRTPNLWKRLLVTVLFASLALMVSWGASLMRYWAYRDFLAYRAFYQEQYQRAFSEEELSEHSLNQERNRVEHYDYYIEKYEAAYEPEDR